MKIILIIPLLLIFTYENVIELDFEKGITTNTKSDKTITIVISLKEIPDETIGIINLFTEKENSLKPLFKKFAKKKDDAESIDESEDDSFTINIETFPSGKRFRILFTKTSSKEKFLSLSFEKLKDTKITIYPSKYLVDDEETSVHDIFTKEHTIKSEHPIYFKISLKSLSEYKEDEVSKKYHSQITFFSEEN